jgi:large subunit ribosomal protein L18
MDSLKLKKKRFLRRKRHIRKNIFGNSNRMRLTISRSNNHIFAQIINDVEHHTYASASSLDKEVIDMLDPKMKKVEKSKIVGKILAKRALTKDIKNVVFDRNGYLYHGRVKALADGARESGLNF